MKIEKINPIKIVFYLFVTFVAIIGIWFYKNVLSYFILSFILAFFLNPFVKLIERYKINRTLAIIIAYLILFFIIFLILFYLVPALIDQGKSFAYTVTDVIQNDKMENIGESLPFLKRFQNFSNEIEGKISFINFDDIKINLMNIIETSVSKIPDLLMNSISSLMTLFTFLMSVPVVGFFLLKDHKIIKKSLYKYIPNRYFELVILLSEKFDLLLGTYLRALLIETSVIGILSVIALWILGINNFLIIGIFAGLANVIPYLGPLIGIIFAVISVFFSGKPLIIIVWVIISMLIVQVIDNIMVYPLVMGKNTEMHPLIILLTVIAGSYAYGLIGMLISVPIVFILKEMINLLYKSLKGFEII